MNSDEALTNPKKFYTFKMNRDIVLIREVFLMEEVIEYLNSPIGQLVAFLVSYVIIGLITAIGLIIYEKKH